MSEVLAIGESIYNNAVNAIHVKERFFKEKNTALKSLAKHVEDTSTKGFEEYRQTISQMSVFLNCLKETSEILRKLPNTCFDDGEKAMVEEMVLVRINQINISRFQIKRQIDSMKRNIEILAPCPVEVRKDVRVSRPHPAVLRFIPQDQDSDHSPTALKDHRDAESQQKRAEDLSELSSDVVSLSRCSSSPSSSPETAFRPLKIEID